ncbi:unnamed protein product [Cylicocyclus nassatus]|uniref:UPAR/Ly6 domain-containing protein n=1 Tax=Cylicocyclus nassatus TaxID=53992 RepID=A0AA36H937_CYLNA|nr:unnamed protein product [Cylicocyclus nassatus]
MWAARSLPLFSLLIDLVRSISSNNSACYSCVALNYRSAIPSRNGPLPPPLDPRNLSELFDAMRTSGIQIPPLTDACADLAPSTSPTTFMRSPVILCESKTCSKLSFNFKGEKVVVRDCITNTFANEELLKQFRGSCSQHSSTTIGLLSSVSLCECERDLCNSSERHYFHGMFLLSLLFL